MHFAATPDGVERRADMDGETYERWVARYDVDTWTAKGAGNLDIGVRFVKVTGNAPKTWSLAAALDPEIAAAYDTDTAQAKSTGLRACSGAVAPDPA